MTEYIKPISAKETYALRHEVMWPNMPFNHIILPKDEEGVHFGLFVNDKLIAVVSTFTKNNEIQFRKLATATLEQGKGYGGRLLAHVVTYAKACKVSKIWCNARRDKTEFYFKFGFEQTNTIFTKYNIDYVVMEKMIKP